MTRITKILTHPGSAHKDEFLACCVMLAGNPVPVHRREPEESDLADPAICVIDVGHQHAPELHNFDHHQFPKDHPPTCSISLVLGHLGLYEDARQFCDWLEPAEWFDCRGALSTAKWLGVPAEALSKLVSPVDVTLLKRFSQASVLEPNQPLWELMRMIGDDLLEYVRSLRERLDFIAQHAQLWTVSLAGVPSQIVFLPRTEPLPEDPSFGVERYIAMSGLSTQVVGTVTPDRRGVGYGLSRYRDNGRLDFTKIASEPGVHFAHARGFVAKTSHTEVDRLKSLLSLAGVSLE